MRSWSIKTVVVTLSIIVTLAAAAPRAEAASSKPSRTHVGVVARFQQAVGQMLKRFGIISEKLPSDPVPVSFDTETLTESSTNSKKIR